MWFQLMMWFQLIMTLGSNIVLRLKNYFCQHRVPQDYLMIPPWFFWSCWEYQINANAFE